MSVISILVITALFGTSFWDFNLVSNLFIFENSNLKMSTHYEIVVGLEASKEALSHFAHYF